MTHVPDPEKSADVSDGSSCAESRAPQVSSMSMNRAGILIPESFETNIPRRSERVQRNSQQNARGSSVLPL